MQYWRSVMYGNITKIYSNLTNLYYFLFSNNILNMLFLRYFSFLISLNKLKLLYLKILAK